MSNGHISTSFMLSCVTIAVVSGCVTFMALTFQAAHDRQKFIAYCMRDRGDKYHECVDYWESEVMP